MLSALTPNRLTVAVAAVAPRIAALSADRAKDLETALDLTFDEHFYWQNAKSRAHLTGRLTTAEATFIYRALGETGSPTNGGWAAGADLATKVVVTQVMGEVLS